MEIADGLGFKGASNFSRAFRRAFDMSTQDMRAWAFELLHAGLSEQLALHPPAYVSR
jgi:AraC-like DNA-binding protein